jgi:Spy/CpxP family protein refolding chaperone
MNPTHIHSPLNQTPTTLRTETSLTARASRHARALLPLLLLTAPLAAQERRPAEGAPRGERPANPGAPRGERQPEAERVPGRGGPRAEFPDEIKLTDDQQARLKAINDSLATKQADLSKKRDAILTAEQKTAQAEAMQKVREGNLSRQEIGDLLAAALKLTPEQKTQIEAVDGETRQLFQESSAQKLALLTDEQRTALRKISIASGVARTFSIPGGITISDEQKAGLKTVQDELGAKLTDLTEKHAALLTDERRTAREAAYKEARESGKDREATSAAINAALNMTDAEKTQLAELETSLRELHQQIRERVMALLTPEQRTELEKKIGTGRGRN